ncbi:MAG: HlyC/CorC family transporter [Flavobacteriales bacterium]|nr:HlyC/CorC family transporter [Crocinitomicaceae bacterium]NBX81443.1 HlyC/CorC family transporter [Flavobacteriales bacterium]NCA20537.1 HlyC/CorC family transporter [Crocinitomicaceae bacterium]
MSPDWIFVFASLLFSAFFAGMELAYLASNRLKIEVQIKQKTIQGKVLSILYRKDSRMIAMLLLGNNIALVVYGISAANILDPILAGYGIGDNTGLVIQTILSTLLVLITAEFLPKAIVQINPNTFLNFGSFALLFVFWILYIPTQIIMLFSNLVLRIFGIKHENSDKVFSKVDLEHYVDDLSSRIKAEEDFSNDMLILRNALDFSKVKARDCMIPRTEIIAVDIDDELEVVRNLFISKGLSKIIVYRDTIDNVIGYVHSYDLFTQPNSIKQVLKPISFVPTVMSGKELLEKFTKQAGNLAVVTDEYGGTAGIITLEDVIEEIFGEIEDEHDKEDWLEQKISEKEFLFTARIDIDYLIETYNLKLEESNEYETLAGLIIFHLAKIPEQNARLKLDQYTFIIEEVSDRKIEKVRLIID